MAMAIISQILKTTMTKVLNYFFAFYGDLKSCSITVKQQDKVEKLSFSVRKSR